MPELPEVETTRRGLAPHLTGHKICSAVVRNPHLRQPVPPDLPQILLQRTIHRVLRRGKYLLLDCGGGWLIVHLGMSGSLRVLPATTPPQKHDHFDLVLEDGQCMRLRDPRRFGAVIWIEADPLRHPLLASLGIEPLEGELNGPWLYRHTRGKTAAIKQALMDSHLIVGVGNIYANEALFRAGIKPTTPAGRLGRKRCDSLAEAIIATLQEAIGAGGSTLRDFVDSSGQPGYFQQSYFVYGRAGEPCRRCNSPIRTVRQGQRSTFYCPHCQT